MTVLFRGVFVNERNTMEELMSKAVSLWIKKKPIDCIA